MLFNVILTFSSIEQHIFNIEINSKVTEEDFVNQIFDELSRGEIVDLIKISICQMLDTEIVDWLMKRNGKFYFNIEINKDNDTQKWYDFKINYLRNLNNVIEDSSGYLMSNNNSVVG